MGAITTHENVIDGKRYATRTFPASEGLVLMPKVLSLLPGNVVNLVFATDEAQMQQLMTSKEVLAQVALNIAKTAAENDGLMVVKDLLKYTRCRDCKVGDATIEASVFDRFDEHFAGDYIHLCKVAWWVGRVSFAAP